MEIRKNIAFTDLCKNPDLAAEVTLQPKKVRVAAIIFSDILVPCMPMGQEWVSKNTVLGYRIKCAARSLESSKKT